MAKSAKKTTSGAAKKDVSKDPVDSDIVGAGNVDKIRDILFGNEMRNYERKFLRLEDRIMKEVTHLRDDSNKRFDALESFIRKELDALSDRQKSEKNERSQAIKALSIELSKASKALEDKILDLDSQLGSNTRDLRQQILDQSKDLSEEIGRKYNESSTSQESMAAELRDEKVDRSALSALLTDIALRISGETPFDHELDE